MQFTGYGRTLSGMRLAQDLGPGENQSKVNTLSVPLVAPGSCPGYIQAARVMLHRMHVTLNPTYRMLESYLIGCMYALSSPPRHCLMGHPNVD
jgi:hypothetical protein